MPLRFIGAAVTPATVNNYIAAFLEGNYSTWAKQWQKAVAADWGGTVFGAQQILVNELTNRLLMHYEGGSRRAIVNLATGALIGTINAVADSGGAEIGTVKSFSRYYAEVIDTGATWNLVIYKDTAIIQTIDLAATLSLVYAASKFFTLAWSHNGKYLVVSGPNWYAASAPLLVALFEGS